MHVFPMHSETLTQNALQMTAFRTYSAPFFPYSGVHLMYSNCSPTKSEIQMIIQRIIMRWKRRRVIESNCVCLQFEYRNGAIFPLNFHSQLSPVCQFICLYAVQFDAYLYSNLLTSVHFIVQLFSNIHRICQCL